MRVRFLEAASALTMLAALCWLPLWCLVVVAK